MKFQVVWTYKCIDTEHRIVLGTAFIKSESGCGAALYAQNICRRMAPTVSAHIHDLDAEEWRDIPKRFRYRLLSLGEIDELNLLVSAPPTNAVN